jgi:hypothetical protein
LFAVYLRQKLALLLANLRVAFEVGTRQLPLPVHFSFAENDHIEGEIRGRLNGSKAIPMQRIAFVLKQSKFRNTMGPAVFKGVSCFRFLKKFGVYAYSMRLKY